MKKLISILLIYLIIDVIIVFFINKQTTYSIVVLVFYGAISISNLICKKDNR